jgi:hypothetical protein
MTTPILDPCGIRRCRPRRPRLLRRRLRRRPVRRRRLVRRKREVVAKRRKKEQRAKATIEAQVKRVVRQVRADMLPTLAQAAVDHRPGDDTRPL